MADWRLEADRRLAAIGLAPIRRHEIIEEVAAYIQDRYHEFLSAMRETWRV